MSVGHQDPSDEIFDKMTAGAGRAAGKIAYDLLCSIIVAGLVGLFSYASGEEAPFPAPKGENLSYQQFADVMWEWGLYASAAFIGFVAFVSVLVSAVINKRGVVCFLADSGQVGRDVLKGAFVIGIAWLGIAPAASFAAGMTVFDEKGFHFFIELIGGIGTIIEHEALPYFLGMWMASLAAAMVVYPYILGYRINRHLRPGMPASFRLFQSRREGAVE